jgi:predicted peptidase
MMHSSLIKTVLLFLIVTGVTHLQAGDYEARIYTAPDGKTLQYRLLLPPSYDKNQKYPLILFFHGSGERGNDNLAQLTWVAKDFAQPEFEAKYPCFVIAPQCPNDQKWVEMDWTQLSSVRTALPTPPMQLAMNVLDAVTAEFSVDKNRVYVAGISMGGFGAWDCLTRFPERFAAAVPVCGGGDENTVTAAVARVPVWAFNSSDDKVVPPVRTLNMVGALIKAGGRPRYNLYSDVGHPSWFKAFATPDLYPWLFAQHRDPAGAPSR